MQYAISVKYSVDSSSLNNAASAADNVAKSLNNAGKSADALNNKTRRGGSVRDRAEEGGLDPRSHRAHRGAAGLRGAAGRDFAGLAQAGGETTGIVAAYATLAANIFALTAAFKALSDASKAVQLQKGLEQLGATSGKTLSIVTKNMQEMSGYALSTVEAMKSVASATAAGFNSKEIERLTRVAKGASTALGRDFSDSMDRLTRGTIKLEPELLDELGIMTRLNDAVKAYALQNDKVASSLTQTERRQAFLNAVLAEGEQKFGDIADNVPVSAYDKLSASIRELGTNVLNFINTFPLVTMGLDAIIKFPTLALLPLVAMFQSVFSKLLGSIDSYMSKAKNRINEHNTLIERSTQKQKEYLERIEQVRSQYTPQEAKVATTIAKKSGITGYSEETDNIQTLKKMSVAIDNELIALRQRYYNVLANGDNNAIQRLEKKIALYEQLSIKTKQDIAATNAAARFLPTNLMLASQSNMLKDFQKNTTKFEQELFESSGRVFGSLQASLNAVGRDLRTTWSNVSKAGKDSANAIAAQYDRTTANLVDKIKGSAAAAGLAWKGAGVTIMTAFQGVQQSLGDIFFLVAAINMAIAAWTWIDETFLGNSAEVKKSRNEIDAIYQTSKKLAVEIEKFRKMSDFGKAIDASINSMTELKQKFYELRVARENATNIFGFIEDFGKPKKPKTYQQEIISRLQISAQNTGSETAKYLAGVSSAMTAFSEETFNKYISDIYKLKSEEELIDYLDSIVDKLSEVKGAFNDVSSTAKSIGDNLTKLKTPDIFDTPYKTIADGFTSIAKTASTTAKVFAELGYDDKEAKIGFGKALLSAGPDAITELGVVAGKQREVKSIIEEVLVLESKRNLVSLNQKLTEAEKEKQIKEINIGLEKQYINASNILDKNTLLKVETKAYDSILAEANLKLAKLKQTQLELVAASMKHANSMAKISRDMGTMSRLGSTDMGAQALAAEEVIAAKEALDIAKLTAETKKEVIRMEAELLDKQTRYQIAQQRASMLEKYSLEDIENAEKIRTGTISPLALAGMTRVDPEKYTLILKMLEVEDLMIQAADTALRIVNDQNKAIDDGIIAAQKQLDLAVKKAGLDNHELNIKKSVADQEAKILSIRKEIFSVESRISQKRLELQRMQLEGTAFAQGREVTPQETYTLEKAGLQLAYDNAVKEKEFLLEEHAAKLEAIKFEGQINDLKLQEAILRYEAALKDPNLDPRLKTQYENLITQTQGLRATSTLNQLSMTRYTRKLQQRQITEADLNIDTAAQALANAVDPLTKALGDLTIDRNKAIKQAGLGANFFTSMMSPEVANLQNEYASKYGDIFNADEVQKMAVEQALFNEQLDMGNKLAQSIGQSFSTAFQGLIQGTITAEQAFKQMGISMLQTLAEIYMRMLAIQLISIFTGGQSASGPVSASAIPSSTFTDFLPTFKPSLPGPAAAGGIMPMASGGIMSKQYTPMATGGVMSRSTPVQGIITKPTYLVGEGKYNEAVVPLPNGREIPVQMHGSSGSNNVNVNVNIASNGDTQVSGNDGQNLGAAVARAVQKELLAQKAPGGILNKYGVS